jgi:hypothetical protein
MKRSALAFLFTDWHLQKGNSDKVADWPPFANNKPADNRTISQIKKAIDDRVATLLAEDAPYEALEFTFLNVGLDAIGDDTEPKWEQVWAAIVDRNAALACDKKLKKVVDGIKVSRSVRGTPARLFVAPTRGGKALPYTAYYNELVKAFNVGDPDELAMVIAGWLAELSQTVAPEVKERFEKDH